MKPSEPRASSQDHMWRRRWIIGLSLAGAAIGQVAAVAGSPGGVRSRARRARASRPETSGTVLLALVGYGVTAALAGMGDANRARTQPWLPIALAAKGVFDVAAWVGLGLAGRERPRFDPYCQLGGLVSLAVLALSLPEAQDAARALGRRTPEVRRRIGRIAGRAQDRVAEWLPRGWRRRSLEELARRAF